MKTVTEICVGLLLVTAMLRSEVVHSFAPSHLAALSSSLTRTATDLGATRSVGSASTLPVRANELIEALWGDYGKTAEGGIDIDKIVSACSEDVVWEDMRMSKPVRGKEGVADLLRSQLPDGTTIVLDKVSDGADSAGFTWTRQVIANGKQGLRGTTYLKLNEEGKIECLKELAEPLSKPGDLMLKLLQAATKNAERPVKNPTYVSETPTSCTEIVDYVWNKAYPKDAPVEESLKFYTDDIVYQDFNYPLPIRGIQDVETFVREWGDFPGIDFRIVDLSQGDVACVFTWRVTVNGQEGPQGISFYETDGKGKITYIRDTPAPSTKPVFGNLAKLLRPKLHTFRSRKNLVDGIPAADEK